ncbi:DUF1540 domain-containing protein [Arcanobacterium haemolyticum]|nr:DUF1540 domain-containing protein [Arcanobacterium haemolyticum]
MSAHTTVSSCATTSCAFNNGGCNALAITVTGKSACGTFIQLDARAGVASAEGTVGACQRLECVHNEDLLCTAGKIDVAEGALCSTFEAR